VALVTGGAGFIGTNLAARLVENDYRVRILDNLSRKGVDTNLQWLCATFGNRIEPAIADIRRRPSIKAALNGVSQVYHFAAQVDVTASLDNPMLDFAVNAGGTLNLLEELRALSVPPSLLYTSTNKVYGNLDDVDLVTEHDRYMPASPRTRDCGISERRRIDFHSPYGCSKGAADQYVLDYARTFGLPAVVFRLSCIYGPHQSGTEDQGWVANFVIRTIENQSITIYGDGMQVRDLLFVDDLVDAMVTAHDRIHDTAGEAFNIGGGPQRTTSLVEFVNLIGTLDDRRPHLRYGAWRKADQRYYVSDTSKYQAATGWTPHTTVQRGACALYKWLQSMRTPTFTAPVRGAL
jgi:CDP-paratose 2-epimerase